jgi:hypothetical protein
MLRVHATMLLRKTLIPSTVTSEPNPNGFAQKVEQERQRREI